MSGCTINGDPGKALEAKLRLDEVKRDLREGRVTFREAVTVREVSHRYDIRKFRDDKFGDYCHEVNGVRTCNGKPFFEISHRPGYRFYG